MKFKADRDYCLVLKNRVDAERVRRVMPNNWLVLAPCMEVEAGRRFDHILLDVELFEGTPEWRWAKENLEPRLRHPDGSVEPIHGNAWGAGRAAAVHPPRGPALPEPRRDPNREPHRNFGVRTYA